MYRDDFYVKVRVRVEKCLGLAKHWGGLGFGQKLVFGVRGRKRVKGG